MVGVAQLVELQVVVLVAAGSSPVAHPTSIRFVDKYSSGIFAEDKSVVICCSTHDIQIEDDILKPLMRP